MWTNRLNYRFSLPLDVVQCELCSNNFVDTYYGMVGECQEVFGSVLESDTH